MAYFLTQQDINYGRAHETILSGNGACPMSRSKIAVGAAMGVTSSGANASTDLNGTWAGYYGSWSGELGRWGQFYRYLQFRGVFLRRFIPTRFRWYWTRDNNGWAHKWHSIGYWNSAGQAITLWNAAVSAGSLYDYTVPDSVLLQMDIQSSVCGFWFNMEAQNNGGNFRGIGEIRGFQTPYPNIAKVKDSSGSLSSIYQTIAYKDGNGVVHTAGRLL